MHRVIVSFPQSIRFVRLDSEHAESDRKSMNRGLPVLDLSRCCDSWCWPKGAWPLGTRISFFVFATKCSISVTWQSKLMGNHARFGGESISLQWWKHAIFHSMGRGVIPGAFWTRSHKSTQRVCNSKKSNSTQKGLTMDCWEPLFTHSREKSEQS